MDKNKLPFVSALLVTRNEKSYIEMSLMSLINQTYPKDKYEIVIADGKSDDGTLDIIKSLQEKHNKEDFKISVVTNEKLILAAGWNLAIKLGRGEYVARIDAHAEAAPDFIEKSVETMMQVDVACVGGKLKSLSLDGGTSITSKILSSPFGVGNSSFRVSDEAAYVDTAVYGLYKKSVFEEVGYFDESLVRSQDLEIHARIKKAGMKFYFNPAIKSTYYTRTTVQKVLRQAYDNGYWNMILFKKGCSALSVRHLVPFAFDLYLIVSIISGLLWRPIWWLCLGIIILHFSLGLTFAIKKTHKLSELVRMPWLFMALHLSYGWGYIKAMFKRI